MASVIMENLRMRKEDWIRFGRNLKHESFWYAVGEGLNDSGLANRALISGIVQKVKGEFHKHE